MADDTRQDLQRTFDLAGLRREARTLATAEDWRGLQAIREKFETARQEEASRYRAEYTTRVETARKQLIDEAGRIRREHTHPWFGRDRFDKAAILRQAHRQVRADHTRALVHIDREETHALDALLERVSESTRLRGKPTEAFNQSVERRSGRDRRRPRER